MRYLKHWLSTSPTELKVLDIAYVTVLLPLLFIIKLPMVLFLLIVIALITFRKKATMATQLVVLLLGAAAIFFSLYGSFNFAGLSRLKLFVELLIYLLFLAVSLQRLTRETNFYLRVSPALLLALSLFFFHSIPMLVYVLIEVFILATLLLWQMMQTPLKDTLSVSTLFYLISLPIVVLFFIFFPRISFEHASYGFKGDVVHRTGHDGLMHLDKNALLVPSQRIIMEVGFQGSMPLPSQLYFRGSVLYKKENKIWKPMPFQSIAYMPVTHNSEPLLYKVTLYPTDKKWLYLLDIPLESPEDSKLNYHLETTLKKPLKEPLLYTAASSLQPSYQGELPSGIKRIALSYSKQSDPKTQKAAKEIKAEYLSQTERFKAVKNLFRKQQLTYTLTPKPFDLDNSTDSFLFEQKSGYCVHFAAAFTTLARMAGIPTRIVTGYKSDGSDSVENYLIIREDDAHAWVEVYLKGKWQRVETTAFAVSILEETSTQSQTILQTKKRENSLWKDLNLYFHYIKYQVDTWILEYSALSQKKLFSYLKSDTIFLLKFIISFILFILLLIIGWYLILQKRCKEPAYCAIEPLLKKLHKLGYAKQKKESVNEYFERIGDSFETEEINTLYHQLRYHPSPQEELLKHLKSEVKQLIRSLKHRAF